MNFTFFIFLIYCCIILWLINKNRKTKISLKNCELIFLLFLVALSFLLPGDDKIVAQRMCFLTIPLAFLPIWQKVVFVKDVKRSVITIVISLLAFFACELCFYLLQLDSQTRSLSYMVIGYILIILFHTHVVIRKKLFKFEQSVFNPMMLYNVFVLKLSFVFVCCGILFVIFFYGDSKLAIYLSITALLACHIIYVYLEYKNTQPAGLGMPKKKKAGGYRNYREDYKDCMLQDAKTEDIDDTYVMDDARIVLKLVKMFEKDHLYRRNDIKVNEVALMLGTNKTYLSRALNTRVAKNFCQFVNYYRIREICATFINNPNDDIRKICEQCGFSSASNFSIVFKYNTGYTPGDWCKMVKYKIKNNEPVSVEDYIV